MSSENRSDGGSPKSQSTDQHALRDASRTTLTTLAGLMTASPSTLTPVQQHLRRSNRPLSSYVPYSRLTAEERVEFMGEHVIDSRTVCLQVVAETILYGGFVLTVPVIMLKLQMAAPWSWFLVLTPLWFANVVSVALLIVSLFAPIPYLKQLARYGQPRLGDNPSGTELISITIAVVFKIIASAFLISFEVLLVRFLDDKLNNHGSEYSLWLTGVPLYILQLFGLCYTFLIEDQSLQILLFDVCSIVMYLLMVVKVDLHAKYRFWITTIPMHILLVTVIIALLLKKLYTTSKWHLNKWISWLGLLLGSACIEASAALISLTLFQLESNIEISISPAFSLLPLLFGLFAWLFPIYTYSSRFMDPLALIADFLEPSRREQEEIVMREPLLLNGDDDAYNEEDILDETSIPYRINNPNYRSSNLRF